MKREPREVWEQRVRRWKESGLTAKEFASELGINVHTLNGWRWKLGGAPRATPCAAVATGGFVEVALASAAEARVTTEEAWEPFELVFARGLTVRVPVRFDASALQSLVTALEAR